MIEDAHDAELEERERQSKKLSNKHSGGVGGPLELRGGTEEDLGPDTSGVWQETESGIQWVATVETTTTIAKVDN